MWAEVDGSASFHYVSNQAVAGVGVGFCGKKVIVGRARTGHTCGVSVGALLAFDILKTGVC